MSDSWYYISISDANWRGGRGRGVFFEGRFRVYTVIQVNNTTQAVSTTRLVTEFYETIDGSVTFSDNILESVKYGADNIFNSDFSSNGTIINSMYYFSNSSSENYTPEAAYFRLLDMAGLEVLNATGNVIAGGAYLVAITPTSDPSCFNEGTKILCLNNLAEEEYLPIENLRKGHLVKSYKHGYRKIDLIGKNPMINNPEIPSACMYKMEKTDHNGLTEDLIVTGGHSILVDDLGIFKEDNDKLFGSTLMIDDKYLLIASVSNQFIKLENTNLYTYYHFILENEGNDDERFGVWANGMLTETPSKNQFTSHKYTLL